MRPVVNLSCLSRRGRFGNQLFQYAFARRYCERYGAELQTPPWVGQDLFRNVQDPLIEKVLPPFPEDRLPQGETDIDLTGYFQRPEHLATYTRSWARDLFWFQPHWLEAHPKRGDYAAAHLRRGDYLEHQDEYAIITLGSYRQAHQRYCPDLPLVWVREKTSVRQPYAFVPDFLRLMQADALLRANSTFSWWAGTLGHGRVYSPNIQQERGVAAVDFVEGNHCRLTYRQQELRLEEGDHRLWHERGYWLFKDMATIKAEHQYSPELAAMLVKLLDGKTVCDLGCGLGSYVAMLRSRGIEAVGFDGNPHTMEIAETRYVSVQDLSVPFRLPAPVDWVISFEVGEHIPREYEDVFLDNLTANASEGIVLSWAVPTAYDNGGTMGHVNSRDNVYIIERLARRGWMFDAKQTRAWRKGIGARCIHFRDTLMLFRRKGTLS